MFGLQLILLLLIDIQSRDTQSTKNLAMPDLLRHYSQVYLITSHNFLPDLRSDLWGQFREQ